MAIDKISNWALLVSAWLVIVIVATGIVLLVLDMVRGDVLPRYVAMALATAGLFIGVPAVTIAVRVLLVMDEARSGR